MRILLIKCKFSMGNIHTGVEQLQSLKRPAEEDNSQIGKANKITKILDKTKPLAHCMCWWLKTGQKWGRMMTNLLVAQQTP